MPEHQNRITGPIDIAVKRLSEESARLMETLVGPAVQQRRTMIDGQDVDPIIEAVLTDTEIPEILR